jgi:D-threonine aldolase
MSSPNIQDPSTIHDLITPSLVVDVEVFDHNRRTMDGLLPGARLRPHVKAFKSTALAGLLVNDGHQGLCAATVREVDGLVRAGLGTDVLLANESLRVDRLGATQREFDDALITVAVDSDETLDAVIAAGLRAVLIDIDVGLPRCGCEVDTGARLADRARAAGIDVRGVMGYEGHLMMVTERTQRVEKVGAAMSVLRSAADRIGGNIVSGGGTGTFDVNTWCTEIQAGSYLLMDTHYAQLDLPFRKALSVHTTVISKNAKGWIVVDGGLKALGMDHGNPSWDHGKVFFCSDEHTTLLPDALPEWNVGDRVQLWPAHVDPTVAYHEQMWVAKGERIVDRWPIDLRNW